MVMSLTWQLSHTIVKSWEKGPAVVGKNTNWERGSWNNRQVGWHHRYVYINIYIYLWLAPSEQAHWRHFAIRFQNPGKQQNIIFFVLSHFLIYSELSYCNGLSPCSFNLHLPPTWWLVLALAQTQRDTQQKDAPQQNCSSLLPGEWELHFFFKPYYKETIKIYSRCTVCM